MRKLGISFTTIDGTKLTYPTDRSYLIGENAIIWFKNINQKNYLMGIDYYTLRDIRNIEKITMRKPNTEIDQKKALLRIETEEAGCCGGFKVITIYSPGKINILEINEELKTNPIKLIQNPFSIWIYKVNYGLNSNNDETSMRKELNSSFGDHLLSNPELIYEKLTIFLRKKNFLKLDSFDT